MFKVNSYIHLIGYFCFGIALLIAIDPGWSIWLGSLQYDLHEGENILPRLLVLLCSSVIVLLPFLGARRYWLLVYSLLLFPLCLLGYSFVLIQGQFTFWEVSIVINEWGLGADALSAFLPQVAMATGITLAVIVAIWVLRPRLTETQMPLSGQLLGSRRFQAALFLPWLLPTAYLLLAGGGYWINHFALPLKVPASLAFSLSHPVYVGPRNAVVLEAPATKPVNLIFIVDESVRGDFLGINNIDENTTPFLEAWQAHSPYENFGVVNSVSNCSAPSNLLLRTGADPEQAALSGELALKTANIFQYARHSGLRTVYLDAQVTPDRLQNYFTQAEISQLDQFVALQDQHNVEHHQLDHQLARDIIQQIKQQDQPLFIYANKIGAHFPYEATYPPEMQKTTTDKLNHYRQALRWNVDTFFKILLPRLKELKEPTLIVYTSDHGQGLGEHGNNSTHCLPTAVPAEQAKVPLLLFSLNTDAAQQYQLQPGQYSQFQVFSSLLNMMGYPSGKVRELFGQDLSQPWQGPRYFYSGDLVGNGQLSKNVF